MFAQQQVCDQVSGEDEENKHTQRAVASDNFKRNMLPFHQMAENYERDRDRPHSIKGWDSPFTHKYILSIKFDEDAK